MKYLFISLLILLPIYSHADNILSDLPTENNYTTDVEWYDACREWLREYSTHGIEAWRYPLDPPAMIRQLRNGGSATCGTFSVAYAGLMRQHKIPVRLIHIYRSSADGRIDSHTFNEVWSTDYNKWVVQDVDYNLSWRDGNSIPMSAGELQSAMIAGKIDHPLAPFFYRLVISTQLNYIGCPYMECQRGYMTHIPRIDEQDDPAWIEYKKKWGVTTLKPSEGR